MQYKLFLAALALTVPQYHWTVEKDGRIRAKARNKRVKQALPDFDPVTAVARHKRKGTFTPEYVIDAGAKLGLSEPQIDNIVAAVDARKNKGFPQQLRGQIKRVLKLK